MLFLSIIRILKLLGITCIWLDAGNTNEVGMHLLGDYTTWNFINLGDPDGTLLKNKPTVKYGKNTSKSEQLNFAISYSRVFGKHDVSATAVVERAESEGR